MTDVIDIAVRESGSNNVANNLSNVGGSARRASSEVALLNSAIAALGAVLSVQKIMAWADAWNSAEGLIRTSTGSLNEAAAVSEKVYKAAQLTRVPISEMADLYTATARAGRELGASQNDVIKFSEGVGKALAIQHTSAAQAKGMLIQLGQAISMGRVRAQEYNSMLQNGQVILQTVAGQIDAAGGSVSRLTTLVKSGQVSSKEFFDAFLAGSDKLDDQFNKTSFLFSQAFTVMNNAISKYVGELDYAVGASAALVKFVQWMSDNMPLVAGLVAGFGTTLALALAPAVITRFIGLLNSLWIIVAANPFVLLAAAVAGVTVALLLMKDTINLGLGDATTLGDLMLAVWHDFEQILISVKDFASGVFEQLTIVADIAFKSMTSDAKDSSKNQSNAFQEFFADTNDGWLGLLQGAAKTFDAIVGFMGATVIFLKDAFAEFGAFAWNELVVLTNKFREFANDMLAAWIGTTNKMREGVGLDPLEMVSIPLMEESKKKFKDLGTIWAESMDAGFSTTDAKGMRQWLDGRIKEAQGLAASRAKSAGADLDTPLGEYNPPEIKDKGAAKAARELKQLKDALADVIGQISPAENALKKLAEAQETLDKAVAKGLITQGFADDVMSKLKRKYEDVLQPLKAMNDEIVRQQEWLKLSNDEAAIEADLYQRLEELKRKGAYLTDVETQALRAKLVVTQELSKIAQARDSMEDMTGTQKMQDFMVQLEAMKQLLEQAKMGQGDKVNVLSDMFPWADLSGTKEQMDAYVSQHQMFLDQIAAAEDAGVIKHQTAEALKRQADQQFLDQRMATQRQFFGAMAGLMSSSNKKLFAIGKAAALANAVIDGYGAVMKAYNGSPYPYNIAAAAVQAALAAVQIANIANQQPPAFRTGGSMTVGGFGGDDSQLVQFRATPGERVTVNTPSQARALENGNQNAPPPVSNKIVNVMDMSMVGDYLNTQDGEQLLVNVMTKNGYVPSG